MEATSNIGAPRRLRCPVRGVDEGRAAGAKMFISRVVTQVAGEIDVSTAGYRGVKKRVSGARAQSHCGDELVRVTGGTHPPHSAREPPGHALGKTAEGHWLVEVTDAPNSGCVRARAGTRVNGLHVVSRHLIGVSINKGLAYRGAYDGRRDDVDAYFLDGFNLVGGAEGRMRPVEGAELATPHRLETAQVVAVKLPRSRPEEGIAQCLSGIDWYLDSPQVDWLCCRFQGTLDGHPQQPSEHVIDPADCGVGVGMGTHEGNAVANKPVDDAPLGRIRCHRRGAPHQKRMVNDKHIGVGLDGGINDDVSGFQSTSDPPDGVVGIPAHQTGGVP